VAVDWYVVDGPVVASEESASYLTTMLIAVAEQMAQRVQSRPPRQRHVSAAGVGGHLATAASAASGGGASGAAGPSTDGVPPMPARTASGRASKRPSHLSAYS
jgi:hypothetical protein